MTVATAGELRPHVKSKMQRVVLDFLITADKPVPSHILKIAVYGDANHRGGGVKQVVQRLRVIIRPLGWDIPAEKHGLSHKGYRLVRIDQ